MKKSLYVFFILFLISITISNAQGIKSPSLFNDFRNAFYVVYNNLGDTSGNTNFIGIGVTTENLKYPLFEDAEILFPIGNKHLDFSGLINFNFGVKILERDGIFLKSLRTTIKSGVGFTGVVAKRPNSSKDYIYMGFNLFVGGSWEYKNFFINLKYGPIFTTGTYKFNMWNVNMGYFFDFTKDR